MRGSLGLIVALVAMLTVGCAAPEPTSAVALPERPAVPEGWITVSSDAGDVSLPFPPDLVVLDTFAGILLQGKMAGGITPLQVLVVGPRDAQPQPTGGASVRDWLEEATWVPVEGQGGVSAVADRSERELLLPAGRAVEVAVTAQPGTPEASRVVVYAIETSDGVAVLQVLGDPETMERRRDELSLLPLLVTFGD